jgi:ribosome hibernation promoting factor
VRTNVKARNMELTPRLRTTIERKLRRLDRISHPDAEATVEVIANASHANDASHAVEITVVSNGTVLRSVSSGSTPVAALDVVLDKLERQAVRSKERPRSVRERVAGEPQEVLAREAAGTLGPLAAEQRRRAPQISRTKRFDMVPMFEEDAITRMEELGHAFFFFLNAENERLAVLYRRTNGTYGLIEPVLERGRRR